MQRGRSIDTLFGEVLVNGVPVVVDGVLKEDAYPGRGARVPCAARTLAELHRPTSPVPVLSGRACVQGVRPAQG